MIKLTDNERHILCLIAVADKGPRLDGARLVTESFLESAHSLNEVMADHYVNHQSVTAIVTKLIDLGLVEVVSTGSNGRVLGIIPDKYEAYFKDLRELREFNQRQQTINFPKCKRNHYGKTQNDK